MRFATVSAVLVATLATSVVAPLAGQEAPTTTAPASKVPVRELTPPNATSSDHFGLILGVRGLPDGKLLVNDPGRHQLVLLDAGLRRAAIVFDSVAGGSQSYPPGYAPIIPFPGDSTLFVDRAAVSLVVISPSGTVGRTMAPPIAADMLFLAGRGGAVDARGDLVYRKAESLASTASRDTAVLRKAYSQSDSFLVVRASFATGKLDTIGRVKLPAQSKTKVATVNGRIVLTTLEDPLPSQDDYAVLSDGTIGFVRSHDYHVDIVQPNGERIMGPKLPFDWKRLTDADKQALVDSAKAQEQRDMEAIKAMVANRTPAAGAGAEASVKASGLGSNLPGSAAETAPARTEVVREYGWLTIGDIADYYPPIRSGALKADMDANLWILPTTSAQSKSGELVYDVVNNRGELTERVRVPAGRSIAGFGKGGEVYLMVREANGWVLERVYLRR